MKRQWKFANLDEKAVKRVETIEEELGMVVLVMEPHYPAAQLTDDQVQRLQQLENELGVLLLALKK